MPVEALDLRQVVGHIHSKVRSEPSGNLKPAPDGASGDKADASFESVRRSYDYLCQLRNSVGQTPPCPKTLRGWLGSHLVRFVQRMLFWYSPQITAVQEAMTAVLGELIVVLDKQPKLGLTAEVDFTPLPATFSRSIPLTDQFQFALLNRFRSSEEDVKRKLQAYVARIRTLSPPPPPGVWLDVGCGRGEWLALAREAGQEAVGIDSNPLAVAHCASLGLQAQRADALDYLASLPKDSLALISAFHVMEHLPFPSSLACIEAGVGALKPGGLLILEMPNPANLTVGAHSFWNDPTHQRPVPAPLAEFALEFYGLRLERRFDLNPAPPDEQLPWREIPFVDPINQHLYGPRDYGVIARKQTG